MKENKENAMAYIVLVVKCVSIHRFRNMEFQNYSERHDKVSKLNLKKSW